MPSEILAVGDMLGNVSLALGALVFLEHILIVLMTGFWCFSVLNHVMACTIRVHISNGCIHVAVVQGVKLGSKYVLTDPSIHCKELVRLSPHIHNQFGDTNLGEQGIEQFFATHESNPICRKLRLPKAESSQ